MSSGLKPIDVTNSTLWPMSSGPKPIDGTNSKLWAIAKLDSHGVFGGDESLFDLVNRKTGRAHRMRVLSFGISMSRILISGDFTESDYTYFTTSRPANFEDFDGKGAELSQTAFAIYSNTKLTIWDGEYRSARGKLVSSVEITNWGPSIPGKGSGRGVTSVLWGPGTPFGSVITTITHDAPFSPAEMTMSHRSTGKEDDAGYVIPSDILFPFDRPKPGEAWVFDAKAVEYLGVMAKIIKGRPDRRAVVRGHTDSIGPDDYNMALSERRAAAVVQWLTTTGGVKSVDADGVGKGDPVVPNTNTAPTAANIEAQKKNRRIELWLYVRRRR